MSTVEALLRRDRLVVALALILVSVLAWGYLLSGAGMDMSAFEMTRHSVMKMNDLASAEWSPSYALLMFVMWSVMMVAMMLPSATPVVLLSAAINRRSESNRKPYGHAFYFLIGYLFSWVGFSALAVGIQFLLEKSEQLNSMLVSISTPLSATLLLLAGVWQFSPWKNACLKHCRSPVEFLTRYRKPGNSGAFIMGIHHGLYCLGCCWFLMVLLFVGGVMNLYWIIGLSLYVWVEKYAPLGPYLPRTVGAGLILWGVLLLL